jgi:hypothetical protein
MRASQVARAVGMEAMARRQGSRGTRAAGASGGGGGGPARRGTVCVRGQQAACAARLLCQRTACQGAGVTMRGLSEQVVCPVVLCLEETCAAEFKRHACMVVCRVCM